MITKVCPDCSGEKPLDEFPKRKSRSKGLRKTQNSNQRESKCRVCKNLLRKNYAATKKLPRKTFIQVSKKVCPCCKTLKTIDKFFNDRYAKDGHAYSCKICDKSRHTRYRKENPKKIKVAGRESNYRRQYGISIADYDKLFKSQAGKCAICGTTEPGGHGKKHLAVYHDHITGRVRGLLCYACNTGIGCLKDDTKLLENAIQYLTL